MSVVRRVDNGVDGWGRRGGELTGRVEWLVLTPLKLTRHRWE